MTSGGHFVYFCMKCFVNGFHRTQCLCCNEYLTVRAHLTSLLCPPGGGQWGGAQAEVWEALQWGDRNPPEGCSQLYDRPWQGRGYNPPPTRASQSQVHPSSSSTDCLCTHLRDGSPFFSHLPLLFLSGSYIRRHQAPLSSLFIPTLTYFSLLSSCLSDVDIFKRATLGEMVNRCGTGSTHARLSRAKVIPSYVSSPDVLLTAIDFHLFIFTLRIWSLLFL